ncbi:right-handed parallel beta-helix repeat-containing protein [Spirosoma oryzicola]|uniref:right-handed parallel beta-helix repeat-containing protein n=1 Tax=Spirosoma oryzicola TaxID=2898794 RepID=UPI001E5C3ADB|nr:right-handed parallel beta-helix repeat-containing protein [Spirosoma oryzicola]UHG90464.1 right-handed parallel beta-helix repeat-containing protein [Spirosoma oryzicola]
MKVIILIRLIFFLALAGLLTHCKPEDAVVDPVVQRQDTLTINQVRSWNTLPLPSSVRITDTGIEGVFKLVVGDNTSADDMGSILVTANGRRYKRDFTGPANAAWFGVNPSAADIGPALQAAVNAASEVVIPDGAYTQGTSVVLKSGLTIRGNAGKVTITLPKTYVSLVSLARSEEAITPLENVIIDGLSWMTTTREDGMFGCIYIDGPTVNNLTVQNCAGNDVASKDSTNWLTVKIQSGKTASNIVIKNNHVQARRMACEIFNHDNHGIYSGKNIIVSGNDFHNCHFGISLSGPLDGLMVDNNHLTNCSLFGIEIAGAARNVKITNNTFEGTFDKFLTGSNDGNGNGSVVGGMVVTGNSTIGLCTGGVQIFNGGTMQFTKNNFNMTGMLELAHSTNGGTYTENVIESLANKAIICDNTSDNTFSGNTISNKNCPGNHATFMSYGSKATNNVLTNNKLTKGVGGSYYDSVLGGTTVASKNYDEAGNPIP